MCRAVVGTRQQFADSGPRLFVSYFYKGQVCVRKLKSHQDLRFGWLTGRDPRVAEFGPQVMAEQTLA